MPISYLIVPGFASSSKTFFPQPSRDLIQHESGTWSKVTRKGLLPLPDPKIKGKMKKIKIKNTIIVRFKNDLARGHELFSKNCFFNFLISRVRKIVLK